MGHFKKRSQSRLCKCNKIKSSKRNKTNICSSPKRNTSCIEPGSCRAKLHKNKSFAFSSCGVLKVPTFGQAINSQNQYAALVPIRPAFLLAILSQESALGKNVGQLPAYKFKVTGVGKKIPPELICQEYFKANRDLLRF